MENLLVAEETGPRQLDLLKEVSTALEVANYRISEELWSEEDGYYHAWWDKKKVHRPG